MKLLFGLSTPTQAGGIYVTESKFIEGCARNQGVEVTTFPFGSRRANESAPSRVIRLLRDLFAFVVIVRRERPDIVQLNSAYDRRALLRDACYSFLSLLNKQKLFFKYHGSDETLVSSASWFWMTLTRLIVRNASTIGVLSTEERRNFVAAGYPNDKFVVVKNVVDGSPFSQSDVDRTGDRPLLFIGRFVSSKGLLEVIQALAIVAGEKSNVKLVCVGDGPQMGEAMNLVKRLDLESWVSFTGQISEKEAASYYMESLALVLPSRHGEGFSMSIFQAVAAGLPIVTSRIRAAADYLQEPENCLWVEPGKPSALAERILYLLRHPGMQANMSVNNKKLGRDFGADRIVPQYLEVYRQILGRDSERDLDFQT